MEYQSKSYRIKAYKLEESCKTTAPFWFLEGVSERKIVYDSCEDDDGWHLYGCIVKNLVGVDLYANVGDYIVYEKDGSFQVYKPGMFEKLFRARI